MLSRKVEPAPKIFTHEYYARLHDLEQRHWWEIGMRGIAARLLRSHLRKGRPGRVLDAGCGTGSMLSWLGEHAGASPVVGIDLSRYALEFCRERGSGHLAEASITDLPFPDRCFDLVVCLDIIQHLPRDGSDERALRECRRVLAHGGLLYLRTNVRLHSGGRGHAEEKDYHQYTRAELIELTGRAGLALRRITYANMLPALVQTWIRRLRPAPGGSHASGQDHGLAVRVPPLGLNAALKLVMRGETFLLGERRSLPYGHSLICVASRSRDDG